MKEIMIDIETLGTQSSSVILSVAAVKFNLQTGEIGEHFYKKVDMQSCIDSGLKINTSTLKFWMEQRHEVLKDLLINAHPLRDVLTNFSIYIKSFGEAMNMWGNSARFDLGLLHNAYDTIKQPIPWDFRKECDVRTLVMLKPEIKADMTFEGDKHNALHDCFHQIKYVSNTYKAIMK